LAKRWRLDSFSLREKVAAGRTATTKGKRFFN